MADKSQLPEEPPRTPHFNWVSRTDYDALRAAYEAQKAEIERLAKELNAIQVIAETEQSMKESAERRVAELEAALKKYGQHLRSCALPIPPYKCTCGFDEALKGTK